MMNIFQEDIFSSFEPLFQSVQQEKADLIEGVLRMNYVEQQTAIGNISQIDALEINSNNFQIEIDNRKYLLKRAGVNSSANVLEMQFSLSEQLRELEHPFARVIRNHEGSFTTQSAGRIWILTDFIPGNYFSGDLHELEQVGEQVGSLFDSLSKLNCHKLPVNPSVHAVSTISDSVNLLFKYQTSWQEIFPEEDFELLSQNLLLLKKTILNIIDNLTLIQNLTCLPCHIDLHPHNILIRNKEVSAFVDVESLQVSRQLISLAFTTYKLVRQYAVHFGLHDKNTEQISFATHLFINAVNKTLNLEKSHYEVLELCAAFEILRRILIITDLNILHQNKAWNKVLKMHIAGLQEVPIIFNGFY